MTNRLPDAIALTLMAIAIVVIVALINSALG
jgi:hypothetical protein